jgi:glycosyltransferase involved in cell wall biosynthesis
LSGWHIITGEYPPQRGGVADYTRLVACGLAGAGEQVEIWTPSRGARPVHDEHVTVHTLPNHFGPRALAVLGRALTGAESGRVLVQYVPHAFGLKAMNLPFCMWLWSHRRLGLAVMFHEVAFPMQRKQRLRHSALGATTYLMAGFVARAACRIMVATPAWRALLRSMLSADRRIEWLPIPSSIPVIGDREKVAALKRRYAGRGLLVGHFGTYALAIEEQLHAVLPALLQDSAVNALLLGENGRRFAEALVKAYPALAQRIHSPSPLPASTLSLHISACDVMIQPYPDGASTRRTTLMAGLAHGIAVATSVGVATEPLWKQSRAVGLAPAGDADLMARRVGALLADSLQRKQLAAAGARLYAERFDIRHTVDALLDGSGIAPARAVEA